MILDVPELALNIAQYADGRAVIALQRLSRAARDRPAKVQEEIWRCAFQARWPWTRERPASDRAWLATFRTWRRAYAYLRDVRFVTTESCASMEEGTYFLGMPYQNTYFTADTTPALRVSKPPSPLRTAWPHLGPSPPRALAHVEECELAEEPLVRARWSPAGQLQEGERPGYTLAFARPGFIQEASVDGWVAELTVFSPRTADLLIGVEDRGQMWFFNIGSENTYLSSFLSVCGFDDTNYVTAETDNLLLGEYYFFPTKFPTRMRLWVDRMAGFMGISIIKRGTQGRLPHEIIEVGEMRLPPHAVTEGTTLLPFVGFSADLEDFEVHRAGQLGEAGPHSSYATLERLYPWRL